MAMTVSMVATAQVTIQMEKDGGVYKVPCTVNGVKMKFIFDTGASVVSISQTMAQFLLDGEYLSESDIKGSGQSQVADGSIVNHANIVLHDIEIGGMHLHNIDAVVIEGQNAPLLLGQSAISELGRFSIDGNRLIIDYGNSALTDEQIAELEEQIGRYIKERSFAAAIDCLIRIDEAVGLSEYGLDKLCFCYNMNQNYFECIQSCNRWLSEFESNGSAGNKLTVYEYLADSYFDGFENYSSALLWYQKKLDILENADLTEDLGPKFYSTNYDKELIASTCLLIAYCYRYLGMYFLAEDSYKRAIKVWCLCANVSLDDLPKGKIQDEFLGLLLSCYSTCCYEQNKSSEGDELVILSAQCGYEPSISFCQEYNINYRIKKSNLFE